MTRHTTTVAGTLPALEASLTAKPVNVQLHIERRAPFRYESWLVVPSPYSTHGSIKFLKRRLTERRAIEAGLAAAARITRDRPIHYRVTRHEVAS